MHLLPKDQNTSPKFRSVRAILFLTSLCGLVTLFYGFVSFMSFSLMDGWSYFPLSGNLEAYADFYYPVTPLTVWEAQIASNFSNPLVALRIILLPIIPLYFYALYVLLRRITGTYAATILAAIATLAPGALGFEPLAGWNTQSWIFLGIGTSLYVTGVLTNRPRDLLYSLPSGFFFALAILTKQTSVIPVVVILLASFFAGKLISTGKIVLRTAVTALISLLLTLTLSLVPLIAGGMFPAILSQILSPGGKALDPLKSVNDVMIVLSETILEPVFVLGAIWLLLLILWKKNADLSMAFNSTIRHYITSRFVLSFGIVLIAFGIITPNLYSKYTAYLIIYALISVWVIQIFEKLYFPFEKNLDARLSLFLALGPPILIGIALFDSDIPAFFASLIAIDSIILTLGISIQLCLIFLLILRLAKNSVVQKTLDSWSQNENPIFWTIIMSSLLGLGNSVNILSSGGAVLWVWYSIPVVVCVAILIRFLRSAENSTIASYFTSSIVVVALFHFLFVLVTSPYSWWGWTDDSLLENDRRNPKLNYLTGVYLSESAANFYTRVAMSADRAAILSLDPEPSVFTFPNIPATATVVSHQPYKGLNCWVQWYDVCPPALSLEDLQTFTDSPSAVIIWRDLVENEAEIHEDVVRQDFSPLRLWEGLKDQEVESGRWIKVDAISSAEFDNLWSDIDIYYRLPLEQWSKYMKIDWLQRHGELPKN